MNRISARINPIWFSFASGIVIALSTNLASGLLLDWSSYAYRVYVLISIALLFVSGAALLMVAGVVDAARMELARAGSTDNRDLALLLRRRDRKYTITSCFWTAAACLIASLLVLGWRAGVARDGNWAACEEAKLSTIEDLVRTIRLC